MIASRSSSLSAVQRLLAVRKPRIASGLVATLLVVAGFNVAYIFGAAATGLSGPRLAVLLLTFGVAGVVGNSVVGYLIDRFGDRTVGGLAMTVEVVALLAVAVLHGQASWLTAVFGVWGLAAFASLVPLQHRLLHVDPPLAAAAVSWFSTAMYAGIATAPLLGAAALRSHIAALVPLVAAALSAGALIAFLLGYVTRRRLQR